MKVFIRADANAMIGSGHVMRCLTLADALVAQMDGAGKPRPQITFLCRHITDNLSAMIENKGYDCRVLPASTALPDADAGLYGTWLGTTQAADAADCLNVIDAADIVLCDHYGLDVQWERLLRAGTQAHIAVLDDLCRTHDCDTLIDTTYGKTSAHYAQAVPPSADALVGSHYALLRPDFAARRADNLARLDADFAADAPVGNLLLSPGGMDKDNAACAILDVLDGMSDVPTVLVLLGKDAPNLDAVRNRAASARFETVIHAGISDVAALLCDMDLCVGASGSSTWERCCLGLPTLNFTIADNQGFIADTLSRQGIVADGGSLETLRSARFRATLGTLLSSSPARKSLSLAARKICDGKGAVRVARHLANAGALSLQPVTSDDIRTIYDWQCDPVTRRHFVNPEPPSWDEHRNWMIRRLSRKPLDFWIGWAGDIPVGLVRLDAAPERFGKYAREVSIIVAPGFHGRGFGPRLLSRLVRLYNDVDVIAHVKPENTASQQAFLRVGFVEIEADYLIHEKRAS